MMFGDDLSSTLLSFEKDGALLRQRSGYKREPYANLVNVHGQE